VLNPFRAGPLHVIAMAESRDANAAAVADLAMRLEASRAQERELQSGLQRLVAEQMG